MPKKSNTSKLISAQFVPQQLLMNLISPHTTQALYHTLFRCSAIPEGRMPMDTRHNQQYHEVGCSAKSRGSNQLTCAKPVQSPELYTNLYFKKLVLGNLLHSSVKNGSETLHCKSLQRELPLRRDAQMSSHKGLNRCVFQLYNSRPDHSSESSRRHL